MILIDPVDLPDVETQFSHRRVVRVGALVVSFYLITATFEATATHEAYIVGVTGHESMDITIIPSLLLYIHHIPYRLFHGRIRTRVTA